MVFGIEISDGMDLLQQAYGDSAGVWVNVNGVCTLNRLGLGEQNSKKRLLSRAGGEDGKAACSTKL